MNLCKNQLDLLNNKFNTLNNTYNQLIKRCDKLNNKDRINKIHNLTGELYNNKVVLNSIKSQVINTQTEIAAINNKLINDGKSNLNRINGEIDTKHTIISYNYALFANNISYIVIFLTCTTIILLIYYIYKLYG